MSAQKMWRKTSKPIQLFHELMSGKYFIYTPYVFYTYQKEVMTNNPLKESISTTYNPVHLTVSC